MTVYLIEALLEKIQEAVYSNWQKMVLPKNISNNYRAIYNSSKYSSSNSLITRLNCHQDSHQRREMEAQLAINQRN